MRLIGLKKLVKDIKDAYIEVSHDTEIVTYGNIVDKVRNMGGGTSEPTTALKANSSVEIVEPVNIKKINNIVVGSRVIATANAVIKE